MQEYFSDSEQNTKEIAKKLAFHLGKGSFLAVYGDLGVGKTAFVKGLAEGLGVSENIVSPTFTILRAYESGKLPLYHLDVYRIADEDELFEIGFDDYAEGDGICVCECANLITQAEIDEVVDSLKSGWISPLNGSAIMSEESWLKR